MEPGTSPRIVTSKRKIVYTNSSWNLHEFGVVLGEPLCYVLVLKMEESLLLWVGREPECRLGEVALGLPAPRVPGGAITTRLLEGGVPEAECLALRVAAGLKQPIYVCCAMPLDRHTAPMLERALAAEIQLFPECFYEFSTSKDKTDKDKQEDDCEIEVKVVLIKEDDCDIGSNDKNKINKDDIEDNDKIKDKDEIEDTDKIKDKDEIEDKENQV